MTSVRLAASLWSVQPDLQRAEAARLAAAGLELWHWDRSDGSMARAGGFDAALARSIADETGLRSEAHLMLRDPAPELDAWTAFCERVVVHAEIGDWQPIAERIRDAGVEFALAVAPSTDTASVTLPPGGPVLVMSIVPGEAGSAFDPDALRRVERWADAHEVGVDGGLSYERAVDCRRAGASWLVSGTGITAADDPGAWLAL